MCCGNINRPECKRSCGENSKTLNTSTQKCNHRNTKRRTQFKLLSDIVHCGPEPRRTVCKSVIYIHRFRCFPLKHHQLKKNLWKIVQKKKETNWEAHCAKLLLRHQWESPLSPRFLLDPAEVILPASEVSPAHAHAGRRAAGEPVLTAFSHVGAETLDLGFHASPPAAPTRAKEPFHSRGDLYELSLVNRAGGGAAGGVR